LGQKLTIYSNVLLGLLFLAALYFILTGNDKKQELNKTTTTAEEVL
jgi:hypothetical protein